MKRLITILAIIVAGIFSTICLAEQDQYICPDSSLRYLSDEELEGMTAQVKRYALNEIYARHGRLFVSEELSGWFSQQEWYQGYISGEQFDESVLNEYEKYNIALFQRTGADEYSLNQPGYSYTSVEEYIASQNEMVPLDGLRNMFPPETWEDKDGYTPSGFIPIDEDLSFDSGTRELSSRIFSIRIPEALGEPGIGWVRTGTDDVISFFEKNEWDQKQTQGSRFFSIQRYKSGAGAPMEKFYCEADGFIYCVFTGEPTATLTSADIDMMVSSLVIYELSMTTIPVDEEEQKVFTSGDYEYVLLEDGTAEITHHYESGDESLEVPGELDGIAVTSIGNRAFSEHFDLTSITLPDSVTNIEDSAFIDCKNLTSITLSDSVTNIGNLVFANCSSLKSITPTDSVTYIGDYAFSSCSSLTSITLSEGITYIGSNPFTGCEDIVLKVSSDHPYLSVIDGVLFSKPDKRLIRCTNTRSTYTVPDGTKIIGGSAFYNCSDLMRITLPDSLISIEIGAFQNCKSLISITLPDGVTSIGNNAFFDCNSLISITLPDTVTNIGDNAFSWRQNPTFTVERDSYAADYCKEQGFIYTYPDANDWLNS